MTIHPPDKRLIALADREMRRLHSLLAPVIVSDGYGRDGKVMDSPCADWARRQLEKFHVSLATGSAAIVSCDEKEPSK